MELPGLDEPVGLRARAVADPDAVQTQIASGRFVVTPLWKAWGPVLEPAGVDRATLSAILRGYGYEVWLWAAGERTWAQCLEGLAGRVSRRVGARQPATKTRTATRARTATSSRRAAKTSAAKTSGAKTSAAKKSAAKKTRRR